MTGVNPLSQTVEVLELLQRQQLSLVGLSSPHEQRSANDSKPGSVLDSNTDSD